MTATRTSDRRKGRKTIASLGGDRVVVTQLAGMLNTARGAKPRHSVQIIDRSGRQVELPDPLTDVMARAATLMAEGRSVSVVESGWYREGKGLRPCLGRGFFVWAAFAPSRIRE